MKNGINLISISDNHLFDTFRVTTVTKLAAGVIVPNAAHGHHDHPVWSEYSRLFCVPRTADPPVVRFADRINREHR